jgi:ABC-2 type transport system ATP-binding protein
VTGAGEGGAGEGGAGLSGAGLSGAGLSDAGVIRTRGLTKRYGAVTAVRGVDLEVRAGDRYGLLGPNGSGKTTLVRMLLGLVYATSGEIEVLGRRMPRHAREVLPQVGALIEEPAAYPHLSGRTNLALLDAAGPGGLRGRRTRKRRVGEALEQVGLGGVGRRPVKAYSLGMRQRLGLAGALIRRPRLLVLDEPGNGLDPHGIRDLRELLIGLNEAGVTVFLSSHLMAEVEQLCTRVGVLDAGRLVLQDDLAALRAPTGRIVVDTPDADQAVALLDGQVERRDGDRLLVRPAAGYGAARDAATLNARLVRAGLRVSAISAHQRTLEEIVLSVTGTGSDHIGPDRAGSGQAGPDRAAPDQAGPDQAAPDQAGPDQAGGSS